MHSLISLQAAVLLLPFGLLAAVLFADLLRRGHERRAVERGLFGEVVALRWQAAAVAAEIARRHEACEPFDERFFALWPLSEPLVYPGTGAAALGRLSREAVGRIGYFHAQLAGARARFPDARAAGEFVPTPYRVLSGLVRAYYDVDPWVRSLRPRLGAAVDEEPDITAANDLLGRFEEALEEPLAVAYCWVDCAYR